MNKDIKGMLDWQTWCCLCGKRNHTKSINFFSPIKDSETKNVQELNVEMAIEKYFGINIKQNKYLPKMLCAQCYEVILSLNKFYARALKVKKMFEAIHLAPEDINKIDFMEFGLQDEEVDNMKNPLELPILDIKVEDRELHSEAIMGIAGSDGEQEIQTDPDDRDSLNSNNTLPSTELKYKGKTNVDSKEELKETCDKSNNEMRNEYEIMCSKCPKRFVRLQSYTMHLKRKHLITSTSKFQVTEHTAGGNEFRNNAEPQTEDISQMKKCKQVRKEYTNKAERFSCELCSMRFRWKFSLQRHMLLHTGEKPFKCAACSRAFRDKSKLKDHERKYHTKNESFERSAEDEKLNNKDLHISEMNDVDNKITSNLNTGIAVTCTEHGVEKKQSEGISEEKGPYSCKYCHKTFRWKHSALRHIFLHTGQKPFKCSICPQAFRQNDRLKEHIKIHHSNELDSVELSSGEYPNPDNIVVQVDITSGPTLTLEKEAHANIGGGVNSNASIKCSECPQKFKRMQSYRLHMTRKHSHISLPPTQFKCEQCSRIFKFECDLRVHLKMHIPLEARRVIPCQHCDKKFLTNDAVRKHVRHFHMKERYYICEECGKELRSTVSLRVHMMRHTDERPFKCEICHRSYREKSKLKMHMEIHDDNKKICPECGRQFNSTLNLRVHMKVHSDDRRFKCDYCGKTFKRSRTLKAHLILHTGLKPFSCNFCDSTFSTGSSCRLHKRTQHPQELAALEATGGGAVYACAVPSLETLKVIAQTSDNLRPVGSKESKT